MLNASDMLRGLGFEDSEITSCLERKGLLSMELEFTKKCNLRCVYCYSRAGEALENELRLDELKSVIDQARELGASKIILLGGGEPLMYDGIREVVEYIASLGMQQVLFTNGTLISERMACLRLPAGLPIPDRPLSLETIMPILGAVRRGTLGQTPGGSL